MSFSLQERPPEEVVIGEQEYPIAWDFRDILQVQELFRRAEDGEDASAHQAFLLFYFDQIPPDTSAAAEALLDFLQCGRRKIKRQRKQGDEDEPEPEKDADFSFTEDGGLIYAAFLEQYGLDLYEVEDLHWWKFRAMFDSLHDTLFTEVRAARSAKNTRGLPDYERKRYARLRKAYPLARANQEEIDRLNELLSRGEVPEDAEK